MFSDGQIEKWTERQTVQHILGLLGLFPCVTGCNRSFCLCLNSSEAIIWCLFGVRCLFCFGWPWHHPAPL